MDTGDLLLIVGAVWLGVPALVAALMYARGYRMNSTPVGCMVVTSLILGHLGRLAGLVALLGRPAKGDRRDWF